MTRTQTKQYNNKQEHIFMYVSLLVVVSVVGSCAGVYNMYSSSRTAYSIKDVEKQTRLIEQNIAHAEARFYSETKNLGTTELVGDMVAYSPSSDSLRYAQVGGAVYSLLTR